MPNAKIVTETIASNKEVLEVMQIAAFNAFAIIFSFFFKNPPSINIESIEQIETHLEWGIRIVVMIITIGYTIHKWRKSKKESDK